MSPSPLILVVGGDPLTARVCAELQATTGHEIQVVWPVSTESDDALLAAGVQHATSILALASDDALNLAIALRARLLNNNIRVVLRQADALLGAKIEQNLKDCTALSSTAHSAATYAAAALDPGCVFALRFPNEDGPLLGFSHVSSATLGVAGQTILEIEERFQLRVVAAAVHLDPPGDYRVGVDEPMVTFGCIVDRPKSIEPPPERERRAGPRLSPAALARRWSQLNPVLRTFLIAAFVFFSYEFLYFHFALHKTWTATIFYVVETMTNVGFGETQVTTQGPLITFGAVLAMLGGIIFTSIFIGSVSSALTRAQWMATQGLRRIRARGHVVICGGGRIGSAVLKILTASGKRVVLIEPNPDQSLIRRARHNDVYLLTGDAQRDNALDLCDVPHASAVLALTDNDAVNVEIALGARARRPDIPLVVRIENDTFARAVAANFGLSTFSPSALTAPALAGLARFPGTRGRVHYLGEGHTISQRRQGAAPQKPPADICFPLCVWRENTLVRIRDFSEMRAFDDLLFSVPLSQFKSPDPPPPAPSIASA